MVDIMTDRPTLRPVSETWQRALAVIAHPDDMEFGASAAVARWTSQGKHIAYCLVTSGEAGIDSIPPDECRVLRQEEQRRSCEIVGVTEVEFLGFPDGVLEYGVPLRQAIAGAIRRFRPEIVITNNFQPSWGGAALNQSDHIVTGRATLDAARDAGNRWVFNEQIVDGLEPWGGVTQVWAAGSPLAAHGVDTTDFFAAGVESLRAHQGYIDGLGWENFDPAEFLEGAARPAGVALGTTFGSRFEVFHLAWGATDDD
jgi:LmbE family N-acetylglucosaminyl deacetylase